MSEQKNEWSSEWSPEEKLAITRTISGIYATLRHNQIQPHIAAAALMMAAARIVAGSNVTTEQLTQNFKNCLLDVRIPTRNIQ